MDAPPPTPDRVARRRGRRGMALGPTLCLAVTIAAVLFTLSQLASRKLSFREAPGFIRFRVVERTMRRFLTTVTKGENFLRLLGVAAATFGVSLAATRTVKSIDDAGWLRVLPASTPILTGAVVLLAALFAACARAYALPIGDAYVCMAMDLMFMVIGGFCAVMAKLSG